MKNTFQAKVKGGQLDSATTREMSSCISIMKRHHNYSKRENSPIGIGRSFISKATLFILVLAVIALAACSASAPNGNDAYQPANDGGYDADMATDETKASSQDAGSGAADIDKLDANRKIIRNASLDLTAVDVVSTYESILATTQNYGGYELSREQSEQDDYTVIRASLRVPPDHLDSLIQYIKETGDVINIRISTDDITESYYDTEIRLENMEKNLDKYYEYLEDSRNVEETIMVQNQINSLTMEIEALKGKLQLWDSQLSESTVELYIRQVNDPVLIRKDVDWKALSWDDMSYLMTSGLKRVVNFLTGAGQWLLIAAVAAAPIWIPLLIIIILLVRRNRKRKRQRAATMASQQYGGWQQPIQSAAQTNSAQQNNLNQAEGTQNEGENK